MTIIKHTSIDDVFFRAHGIGALIPEARGTALTDKQAQQLKEWEDKIRAGGKITAKQTITLKDYQNRRDTPPELSEGGKTYVQDQWLWNEKGFKRRIKSKYLDKGIYQESETKRLFTEIDGIYYAKNTERISKNNISGECDTKNKIKGLGFVVDDYKSTWDSKTFMDAGWDTLKEWQGRAYMFLYDADVFRLRYGLVDAPSWMVKREQERLWREFYSDTMSPEEQHELEQLIEPMQEQIERNLVYSNSKRYTKEERVKEYILHRDDEKFKELTEKVKIGLDYYKTLSLNRLIENKSVTYK